MSKNIKKWECKKEACPDFNFCTPKIPCACIRNNFQLCGRNCKEIKNGCLFEKEQLKIEHEEKVKARLVEVCKEISKSKNPIKPCKAKPKRCPLQPQEVTPDFDTKKELQKLLDVSKNNFTSKTPKPCNATKKSCPLQPKEKPYNLRKQIDEEVPPYSSNDPHFNKIKCDWCTHRESVFKLRKIRESLEKENQKLKDQNQELRNQVEFLELKVAAINRLNSYQNDKENKRCPHCDNEELTKISFGEEVYFKCENCKNFSSQISLF